MSNMILRTALFMETQGFDINNNILKEKKSKIISKENLKKSYRKGTLANNISYFFMMDKIEKDDIKVEYYHIMDMIYDLMINPIQSKLFQTFMKFIMVL